MHILVLSTCRKGHCILKEMGFDLSLFIVNSEIKEGDTKFGYKNIFSTDHKANDSVYIELAKSINKVEPIDAVVCFNDTLQKVGLAISQELELWFPVSSETIESVSNKLKCREKTTEIGLSNILYSEVNTLKEAQLFQRELGKPFIIKPLDSTGSHGVRKVSQQEDISLIIDELLAQGVNYPMLAEEFIEGDEFSVECFSDNGKHYLLGVTKKYKDDVTFIEKAHLMPAPIEDGMKQEIFSYVSQVLDANEIAFGASHTEVIVGPNGIQLVETHCRMGGDCIDELILSTSGRDIYRLTINHSLYQSFDFTPTLSERSNCSVCYFIMPEVLKKGTIRRIDGEKECESSLGVQKCILLKNIGDTIGEAENSFDRLALLIVDGNTPEEAMANAEAAASKIKYECS